MEVGEGLGLGRGLGRGRGRESQQRSEVVEINAGNPVNGWIGLPVVARFEFFSSRI